MEVSESSSELFAVKVVMKIRIMPYSADAKLKVFVYSNIKDIYISKS